MNNMKEELTKINKLYNPFVTILDDYSNENEGPLKGLTYACKDNISTKGILTTGSSNALKDYVPFFDATIVTKLKASGAIMTSKTALDEFGLGATGTTCHTGSVLNPWDTSRISGGSSAGSAVITALGTLDFALGTDTGDSIRKPAAYVGVVGYKPTYGLISRYGVFPFAASLDTVGLFARNTETIAKVMDTVKGKDFHDMTSIDLNVSLEESLTNDIKNKKLFYIKELVDLNNYDNPSDNLKETISKFKETLEKVKSLGIEVVAESIDIKLLNALYPTYNVISCAEATSNLSMYTGIIYGPRGKGDKITDMVRDYRTNSFHSLIKRRMVIGSYVLQKENQDRYYLNACKVRRLVVDTFNKLFEKYDGCITMAGGIAPKAGEKRCLTKMEEVLENHLCIGNFGGYPSITIPSGFVSKMPIGINITGKVLDDANVLNIASKIENTLGYKDMKVGDKYE